MQALVEAYLVQDSNKYWVFFGLMLKLGPLAIHLKGSSLQGNKDRSAN